MLIYHPAFDAHHCIFRLLLITEQLRQLELAKLQIIDFYYCFPAELSGVSLPASDAAARRLAKAARNPYHGPVSVTRTFREMEPLQLAAARVLAASGIFLSDEFETGAVIRSDLSLPDGLANALVKTGESQDALHRYVLTSFGAIPLLGEKGLKRRTGLMEFRYDPA